LGEAARRIRRGGEGVEPAFLPDQGKEEQGLETAFLRLGHDEIGERNGVVQLLEEARSVV
jgi:hypothetical protein